MNGGLVTAPVLRRGLPFIVAENVPIWNGTVWFDGPSNPTSENNHHYHVSSSADEYLPLVCGQGTAYPLILGPERRDVAKWLYQMRSVKATEDFAGFPPDIPAHTEHHEVIQDNNEVSFILPRIASHIDSDGAVELPGSGFIYFGGPLYRDPAGVVKGEDDNYYGSCGMLFMSGYSTDGGPSTDKTYDAGTMLYTYSPVFPDLAAWHINFHGWHGIKTINLYGGSSLGDLTSHPDVIISQYYSYNGLYNTATGRRT